MSDQIKLVIKDFRHKYTLYPTTIGVLTLFISINYFCHIAPTTIDFIYFAFSIKIFHKFKQTKKLACKIIIFRGKTLCTPELRGHF